MNHLDAVDILLVEDNPRDAELTLRALKKRSLANRVFVVEGGAEAQDFIFDAFQEATSQLCFSVCW
jgi:two-component system response regulator